MAASTRRFAELLPSGKSGVAIAGLSAAAVNEKSVTKFGAGIAPFTAIITTNRYSRAGTGISERVVLGERQRTYGESGTVYMGYQEAPILTTFTGSDENPLSESGNWAKLNSNVTANVRRVGNRIASGDDAQRPGVYWTLQDYGPNVEVIGTVPVLPPLGQWSPRLIARVQQAGGANTWDGYFAGFGRFGPPDYFYIYRITNASLTFLHYNFVHTFAPGDRIKLSISGAQISAFASPAGTSQWIAGPTFIDTTPHLAAGKVGVWFEVNSSLTYLDDFAAATFTGLTVAGSKEVTWSKSGAGRSAFTARGAKNVNVNRSATAVLNATASGTGINPLAYFGSATSAFTATGSRGSVLVRAATAIAFFTVDGFFGNKRLGLASAGFTASGWLRNIYANDLFANREIIPSDMTEVWLAGRSDGATVEAGEPRTTVPVPFNYHSQNTLWWEYTYAPPGGDLSAEGSEILEIRLIDEAGAGIPVVGLWRGLAVNALTEYSTAGAPFGRDAGRGLDQPYFFNTGPLGVRVQVSSETPLLIQGAKSSFLGGHTSYTIHIKRISPPSEDPIANATILTGSGGVLSSGGTFTPLQRGAIGESDWPTAGIVGLPPVPITSSGDMFYTLSTDVPEVLSFRHAKINPADNLSNNYVGLYKGTALESIQQVVLYFRGPNATESDQIWREVLLEPGEQYFLVVFSTRNSSQGLTNIIAGNIEWEFVDTPSNDDWADREVLPSTSSGVTFVASTRGATTEEGEPVTSGFTFWPSIWYEFTPPSDGWYSFVFGDIPQYASVELSAWRGASLETLELADVRYAWEAGPLALRGGDVFYIRVSSSGGYDYGSITWNQTAP